MNRYHRCQVWARDASAGAQHDAVEIAELTRDRVVFHDWDPVVGTERNRRSASYASFARQFTHEIDDSDLYFN